MPLRNEVISLKELTTKTIYQFLIENKESISKNVSEWRILLIQSLTGHIRADILNYGYSMWKKPCCDAIYSLGQWMQLSFVLFDKGIDYLPPVLVADLKTDLPLFRSFVSYLWIHQPNVKKLLMNILLTKYGEWRCNLNDIDNCKSVLTDMSKCFDNGLASKLVELQLTYICNDSMLFSIGLHARCLKILDVSSSPNISANGIKGLIFKGEFHQMVKFKRVKGQKLFTFLKNVVGNQGALNAICFTLQELHLENIQIHDIGWIVILSCIQNLVHIGWHEKWNVIEIMMTVWHEILKPKSLHLSLARLLELEISHYKIFRINECIPCLKEIGFLSMTAHNFARPNNVDLAPFWNNLHKLHLHLESSSIEHFENICKNGYIKNLLELSIVEVIFVEDGFVVFDFMLLQRSCPNLLTLTVLSVNSFSELSVRINLDSKEKFRFLKKVVVQSPPTELKLWLLYHACPALEDLEIVNEKDFEFWKNIISDPAPLICQHFKRLEIAFDFPFERIQSTIRIHHSIIIEFIKKCSVLEVFGCVKDFCMNTQDVEIIHDFIRFNNYSLIIV